ncbi:hypothetical protein GMOD_00000101 [Pyrenophora seminiperda CCB06]|uniref:Uncharacterized protein n=1 Tax=Pyrenophora seminiperda CCB06 TaxID=1302712 RepID=A0A3M7M6F3_9PLEO|nr:hypothetical protein GMOD_00000101 [Pyrenophora seminiperda CCB06]
MERTIIIIGAIAVSVVLLLLVIVSVPGCKEWMLKLASCSFRRSQDPVLPVFETVQGQPSNVTIPLATHQPTRHNDLTRQKFKQSYLVRNPGKDARQDELHRKAREGFKPAPIYYYY